MNSGTTAKSCSIRMEKLAWPSAEPTAWRSVINCMTTAVDESDKTKPRIRADSSALSKR